MDRGNDNIIKAIWCFLEALQQSGIQLEAAYLYGSRATDTAHPDSDIDVALISKDFTGDWLEDHKMIVGSLVGCDRRIEPVRFRPEQFCDEHPLAWEIKTKSVKLI